MYYKRNVPKEFQPDRAKMMQKERETRGTEERTEEIIRERSEEKMKDNEKIIASESCEMENVQEKVDECLEESCENSCEKEEEKMFSRENFKCGKRSETSFLPILIILLLIR